MFLLVFAAGAVYASLLCATLIIERSFFFEEFAQDRMIATVVLSIFIVPTLATWLAAELINAVRPRRLLHPRVRRAAPRLAAGLGAGFLGAFAATFMLILLDRSLPDTVLTGIAAAASMTIVLLPTTRVRKAACPSCGYDLSAVTPAAGGVCTECGFVLIHPAPVSASRLPSAASPAATPLPQGCP